jgi:uncharacterized membrane protein YkoI
MPREEDPMRFMKHLALAVAVLVTTVALAGEKPVQESDVPNPALEAVKKKYPKATLKRFAREEEDGKTFYEVTIETGGTKMDVVVTPEGKIAVEEETIVPAGLPVDVKHALDGSKYKGWTIKKAERIVHDEKTEEAQYEVYVVQADGQARAEVLLDRSGRILEEEKKGEKDDEDDGD